MTPAHLFSALAFRIFLYFFIADFEQVNVRLIEWLTNVDECYKLLVDKHIFRVRKKHYIKDALLGLIQFLVTESALKMIKNAFYFTLKALLVLEIFQFLFK